MTQLDVGVVIALLSFIAVVSVGGVYLLFSIVKELRLAHDPERMARVVDRKMARLKKFEDDSAVRFGHRRVE
jgi:hypothetical protein